MRCVKRLRGLFYLIYNNLLAKKNANPVSHMVCGFHPLPFKRGNALGSCGLANSTQRLFNQAENSFGAGIYPKFAGL